MRLLGFEVTSESVGATAGLFQHPLVVDVEELCHRGKRTVEALEGVDERINVFEVEHGIHLGKDDGADPLAPVINIDE